ncbi:MAG: site-specific integrase [Elusimicrobia bacterium]|nr:site-specific integrase [Elusimicrobiota bacterium]
MSIYKKNGNWWIDFYLDGRRKRERIGQSKSLAQEVLYKRKAEIAEGKYFPERVHQSINFREMSEHYMELHGQYRAVSWRYMLGRLVEIFGDKKLSDISVPELQRYYHRKSQETSVATANRNMTLIISMFNRAKAWGYFHGDNPAAQVKRGRETNRRIRYLEEEEIKRLLSVCNPRLFPVLACAIMTGMRKGEMLNLTWENINLDQRIIYILKSKSGKPREIPIATQLQEVLLNLGPRPTGNVFELPDICLRRFFAQALKDAGIVAFRFHDLRHTFASHFIMRTKNLPALQQLLGHASPQMTQRYAHLAEGHITQQMRLFAASMPVQQPPEQAETVEPVRPAITLQNPAN